MNKKVAFITGISGQDGSLLASYLLKKGWVIYGGRRRGSANTIWRLDFLGITSQVKFVEYQLNELQNIIVILKELQPEHIYHLAGESFVADSFKYPGVTLEANTHGTINMLDAIRLVSPLSKLFYASSSEMFGEQTDLNKLSELSAFKPTNPYGISKLAAYHFVRLYRQYYDLKVCSGILFNHESIVRGRSFVTRKITFNMARLKKAKGKAFELGDLNSARDWGAADEYIVAMYKMLNLDSPQDCVIASGRLTKVRDIVKFAAISAGFTPKFEGKGVDEVCIDERSGHVLVRVSPKYFRLQDTPPMLGDPTKIYKHYGWASSKTIESLIAEMVEADMLRWERGEINV
jgi:GDPmannose 4,6-dehydratase